MLRGFAALYEDSLFLSDYDEFMSLESHVLSPSRPQPVPRPMIKGLAFEEVSFAYPDTERTALRDVSLTIRPGEVTALVGRTGRARPPWSNCCAGSTTRAPVASPLTASTCGNSTCRRYAGI